MPNHKYRSARYIANHKLHAVHDVDSAVQLLKLLGSDEASIWSAGARRLTTGAIIRFLLEYQDRMEAVEQGAQRLLLQAAEQVGRTAKQ